MCIVLLRQISHKFKLVELQYVLEALQAFYRPTVYLRMFLYKAVKYWIFQVETVFALPTWLINRITTSMSLGIRKAALRKRERESKKE